jgi:hypothetical protein
LAGLGFRGGGYGGDGRLTVHEDVDFGEAWDAGDNVQGKDGAGDLCLEDGVLRS